MIKSKTPQLSQTTIKLHGPCHGVMHALETEKIFKQQDIFSQKKKTVNYRRADNNGISKDDK